MARYINSEYKAHPILGINGIRLVGLRSGVGRAIEAFLREIEMLDHPFSEIRVYTPEPIDDSIYLPKNCRNIVLKSVLPNWLWEQFILPHAHGRIGPLFCPSYVAPFFAKCPVILTHHGSYEGYPDAFSWWRLKKAQIIYGLSAQRADAISTVSSHSRLDLEKYYGIPTDSVSVIPEGVDTKLFTHVKNENTKQNWRKKWVGSESPYILYVGKATKRRNLENLITAFSTLKTSRNWPHKLVLLGTSLPGTSLEAAIKESGVADDIIMIGFAEPEHVTLAYNCADLLVYPSSYEGFGMPVLEAMACGTPAIALNNTAFPEFSNGIAWLLEDAETDTLADAIIHLCSDEAAKERIRREGPVRAAQYDWSLLIPAYVNLICMASDLPRLENTLISDAVKMAGIFSERGSTQ
ncbi:MAG: glycosyltransferase family 4 protein [Alphaproteobacteria bacterium]|nr:glycosyltransferase family 4 protein [Alphaproteobacteria bacterium]